MVDRPSDLSAMQATLDGYINDATADAADTVRKIKAQALALIRLLTLSPK